MQEIAFLSGKVVSHETWTTKDGKPYRTVILDSHSSFSISVDDQDFPKCNINNIIIANVVIKNNEYQGKFYPKFFVNAVWVLAKGVDTKAFEGEGDLPF